MLSVGDVQQVRQHVSGDHPRRAFSLRASSPASLCR